MMPKVIKYSDPIIEMAERTGLEPATPGVTGRYSNQLNYRSALGCPPCRICSG